MLDTVPRPSVASLTLVGSEPCARARLEDHALARREAGEAVWTPPAVLTLYRWLEHQHRDRWTPEWVLTPAEGQALWTQILREDRQLQLISDGACARLAQRAHDLLLRHAMTLDGAPAYTEEQRAFRRWLPRFEARLRELGALTGAQLLAAVEPDPAAAPSVEAHLWQTAPAAERQLLKALGGQPETPSPLEPRCRAWAFETVQAQYEALAEQLREALLGTTPPRRVLIALPDARAARAALEPALSRALAPWRHQPGHETRLPWRWTRGPVLAERPAADALRQLAGLTREARRMTAWSAFLLHRGLWTDPALRLAAGRLEARLRRRGWPSATLGHLILEAPEPLKAVLQRLADALDRQPRRALPSDWGQRWLKSWWQVMGASLRRESLSYRIRTKIVETVERMGRFDALLGEVSRQEAAAVLDGLLTLPYEPAAEHLQPILIGTPEELVGIACDLLILPDATAQAWLARPAINPFLPIELQRAHGVPEASAASWIEARHTLWRALGANARECWQLVPRHDAEGLPLTPSPFLDAPAAMKPAPSAPAAPPALLEWPTDDLAPPVTEAEALVGNAGTVERFLKAPLLALVVDRLHSPVLPPLPLGLSASLQGQLVHELLCDFWAECRNRERLMALDDAALEARLRPLIAAALQRHCPEDRFGPVLTRIEADRLRGLLLEWLKHERRRLEPFEVIEREAELEGSLVGLRFRLRLDRADRIQTEQGPAVLLVDYKTGREANPRGWEADRLEAPQLPLYAVLARGDPRFQPVKGIAFGHLQPGHPTLSIRTDWTGSLIEHQPQPDAHWPEQLGAWEAALSEAVGRFLAGEAWAEPTALKGFDAVYGALLGPTRIAADEDAEEDGP